MPSRGFCIIGLPSGGKIGNRWLNYSNNTNVTLTVKYKKPHFRVIFLCIGMAYSSLSAENHCEEEVSEMLAQCDGIIDPHEIMDSPVMQTHGNRDRDPLAGILSTYFLRDYVTAQVEGFKYMGSQQDAYFPWPLQLTSHPRIRVVGTETKIVRYNIEKRKVPRYKYNYKYVSRTTYVREGGSTHTPSSGSGASGYDQEKRKTPGKLVEKTVMERELVSVKLVGYETVDVAVDHPEGKYEREVTVAITESLQLGVVRLHHGWHAANAQVAYTMIKAGLPATDPQFQLILQSIHQMLHSYGIPDNTQDVAWLTALYANLPQDDPAVKEWSGKLITRLVTGAAQLGNNRGMWGPVCVNPLYLAEILDFDAKYTAKYITPLQQDLAMEQRERSKERIQEKLTEKQVFYEKWQRIYMTWAMAGTTAEMPRAVTMIPSDSDGHLNSVFNSSLKVPGLVQDPYHFEFTDLESTCIALMALSEVSAAGRMPVLTEVPTDDRGKGMVKPLDVKTQLALSYQTLKRLRQSGGGWDSCFSVKLHKACRDIPYTSCHPRRYL